ncbi:TPA: zinc-finger domain-containing protein [Bacillus toyonensis]|nr:zinc-finger domain-containing protein [Bacillus toyonensis]
MPHKPKYTAKKAIELIGNLEEDFCKKCPLKAQMRKEKKTPEEIVNCCITNCKIGIKIHRLGGILQYGKLANGHLKARDLTKEKYLELRESGILDVKMCEIYNISRSTLTRRKQTWGLNKVKEYTNPKRVAKDLDEETLRNLALTLEDTIIAKMYGISAVTVRKRRDKWGIPGKKLIKERFTHEEFTYLHDVKGLKVKDILELWEISGHSLSKLKEEWGILKNRKSIKKSGLTKEKLIQLTPYYSDREVGEMFGISTSSVQRCRKRWDIPHTLRCVKKQVDFRKVQKMVKEGIPKKVIGIHFGISQSSVYKIIKSSKQVKQTG